MNCYHTTRFFRGKPTVRCYPPVSVPRVAVKRIPTAGCGLRPCLRLPVPAPLQGAAGKPPSSLY
ncbi:MAG: hypothetical protein IKN98_08855 [Bacteroidales bacterium]|nr:hypothetical protein [Bacteroidales bacterium]